MYSPILRNTMNNETQALSTTTTTKNKTKTKTKSSSGVKGQISNKEEKQRRRQARN